MKWSMLCACMALVAAGCGVSSAAPPKSTAPKASPDAKLVERFEANLNAANKATNDKLDAIKSDTTAIRDLLALPSEPQPVPQAPPVDLSPVIDRVQELADAIEELKPQPTPANQSVDANKKVDDAPQAKPPTLLLFSAPWCPFCPAQEARVPALEAAGEVVQKIDDTQADVFQRYGVNLLPTWIRIDATGAELDRVPTQGSNGFTNAELERVLKIDVTPAPSAAAPKVAAPSAVRSPSYQTYRQARRAARGRW